MTQATADAQVMTEEFARVVGTAHDAGAEVTIRECKDGVELRVDENTEVVLTPEQATALAGVMDQS